MSALACRTRLRRFVRLVACLVLATQGVALLLAPAAEARAQHSAPVHVEPLGTHRHYAHNPDTCAACIALQLTPLPIRAARSPRRRLLLRIVAPRDVAARAPWRRHGTPKSPRAPPPLALAA